MLKRREIIRITHIPGLGNVTRRARNAIYLSVANTLAHELKKAEVCYSIRKKRHDFITEAAFNNGSGRADVIDLDEGIAYEIVHSESEESLKRKAKDYPIPVEVVRV